MQQLREAFQINKERLVEHMTSVVKKDSLVAHRSVYGAVCSIGTVSDVVILKSLILAVRNSTVRRKEALAKMTRI
ncbi:hypothetical protein PR048_030703, partial [Dryococelus australis]